MLPLVRMEEYLIVKQLLDNGESNLEEIKELYPSTTNDSLEYAYTYLTDNHVINDPAVNFQYISDDYREYLEDTVDYGLTRYSSEFGEFEGKFKLYGNYTKDQVAMVMLKEKTMDLKIIGTYYDPNHPGDTYVFVGLMKDEKNTAAKLHYKDKFISSAVFQWESKNNTTVNNAEGKKLINTKKVYLFVRKIEKEDGITLPFTYFGTGQFTNMRESFTEEDGKKYPTLLFDIILDQEVPKEYYLDFEIPSK